jgi:hypothetical protein
MVGFLSRHLKGPLVFCMEDGAYLTEDIGRAPLYPACKAAGLRQVGWRVLSHTSASHLAMRGVDLKVVHVPGPRGDGDDAAVHAPHPEVDAARRQSPR